jgi:molybdenum cofactor biosynthesis enzyme MoaA
MAGRLLVMTGTECGNACVFCSARGSGQLRRAGAEIARELAANRRACDAVEFIGGEFTLRPDAVALVKLARGMGYRSISIETNGARLAYPAYAAALLEAGLTGIAFSLHGATAKTHDALTRNPGSRKLLLSGLENMKALGMTGLRINCVVTKLNIGELAKIAAMAQKDESIESVRFLSLRPMDYLSAAEFKRLVPPAALLKKHLPELAAYKKAELKNFPWCVGGAPRRDPKELENLLKSYGDGRKDSVYSSLKNLMAYAPACAHCAAKGACLGVWKRVLEVYGPQGLSAV